MMKKKKIGAKPIESYKHKTRKRKNMDCAPEMAQSLVKCKHLASLGV